jgi:hypothetical protein
MSLSGRSEANEARAGAGCRAERGSGHKDRVNPQEIDFKAFSCLTTCQKLTETPVKSFQTRFPSD